MGRRVGGWVCGSVKLMDAALILYTRATKHRVNDALLSYDT